MTISETKKKGQGETKLMERNLFLYGTLKLSGKEKL